MRNPLLIPLFASLFTVHAVSQSGFYRPPVEKIVLKNGFQILFLKDTMQTTASLTLSFHAGSARDPKGKYGLANIVGTLYIQGSNQLPVSELIRMQREGGISWRGQTLNDVTTVYSTFPSPFLDTALLIESDRLISPGSWLKSEVVEAAISRNIQLLRNSEGNISSKVNQAVFDQFYPKTYPYAHTISGDSVDLKSINLNEVKKFMRMFYVPKNASLTISGNFDQTTAESLCRKYLGAIQDGTRAQWDRKKMALDHSEGGVLWTKEPQTNAELYLVFPTVTSSDPDYPVLKIISKILAGTRTSRIPTTLQPLNQIVRSVSASQISQELDGMFWISITCTHEANLNIVCQAVSKILLDIGTTAVSDDELTMASNQLEMEFLTPLEEVYGKDGRSDIVNRANLLHDDPFFLFSQMNITQKIFPSTIKRVVKKYLSMKRALVLSVVPSTIENAVQKIP